MELLETIGIAPMQTTGKRWTVKVIEGDRQGSSAFYPKEVLEANADKFAGRSKIYLNHPTEDDKFNRPERNAQDIIGYVENGKYDGKDIISEAVIFSDWQTWVKERADAGVIGMSIRASGEVDDKGTLKSFSKINSVDLVTEAGAGGAFMNVLESARAIVSASESGAESEKKEESIMDKELAEALDALVADSKKNAETIAALGEAFKAFTKKKADPADAEDAKDGGADEDQEDANGKVIKKKKPAVKESLSYVELDTALTESELPRSARASVIAAVEGGAVLAEAIAAKKAEVEAVLAESGAAFGGHVSDDSKVKSLEESTKSIVSRIYG